MLRIKEAVYEARRKLMHGSESPQLDAEVILAHLLEVDRLFLIARGEELLSASTEKTYMELIARRACGEPVAYICGEKEFFGLTFAVSPAVLVPRPETEMLVEHAQRFLLSHSERFQYLELGTGSGCITCSLVHELMRNHSARVENSSFFATDISSSALEIAHKNAMKHGVSDHITFLEGSWYEPIGSKTFRCIVSNPPYIPHGTKLAPDLSFEPEGALFSNDDGLSDLLTIIDGARIHLEVGGKLFLECGEGQWAALQSQESIGVEFEMVAHCDLQGIERVLELTKLQ